MGEMGALPINGIPSLIAVVISPIQSPAPLLVYIIRRRVITGVACNEVPVDVLLLKTSALP